MTEEDLRLWVKKCIELGFKDVEKATDEDFKYAAEQVRRYGLKGFDFSNHPDLVPDSILFLIKQGFDLFNLIPEGLALDKTKIK